jgi:glycosyltransferase involved in cell wall biosynthesis
MKSGLIIIPTLGRRESLRETVLSALKFSDQARIVIVTPASKVREIALKFPEIEILPEPGCVKSLYGAINHALEACTGWSWFSYINDDDYYLNDFKFLILEFRKRGELGVIYGDVMSTNQRREYICRFPRACFRPLADLSAKCGIAPFTQQGVIFSRIVYDKLGGFDTDFKLVADFHYLCRILAGGIPVSYVSGPVACFCITPNQLSGDVGMIQRETAATVVSVFGREKGRVAKAIVKLVFLTLNLRSYWQRICSTGQLTSRSLYGNH